jgi:hypothetical protein
VEPLLSPEQEPATNPFRWSGWRLPGFEREPIRWTREYWVPRRVLRAMWLCIMTGSLLGIIVAGVLVGEGRLPVRNFQLHSFIFQVSAFPTPLVRQPYALRIYCREGPNPKPISGAHTLLPVGRRAACSRSSPSPSPYSASTSTWSTTPSPTCRDT